MPSPLQPGSAALDQVPTSGAGCQATDQRGVSRPQGVACDIGAFELGTLSAIDQATGQVQYTPNADFTGTDSFTYHASSGNGAAAIQYATIGVPPPSWTLSVALTGPTSAGPSSR